MCKLLSCVFSGRCSDDPLKEKRGVIFVFYLAFEQTTGSLLNTLEYNFIEIFKKSSRL